MDTKAHTLEEAATFFLENHVGSIECVNGDKHEVCECYPDAVVFFGVSTND